MTLNTAPFTIGSRIDLCNEAAQIVVRDLLIVRTQLAADSCYWVTGVKGDDRYDFKVASAADAPYYDVTSPGAQMRNFDDGSHPRNIPVSLAVRVF